MNSTKETESNLRVLALLVVILLIGLPLAVWLDLRSIAASTMESQATNLSSVVSGIRSFYADDVVARVLHGDGHTMVTDDFQRIPGAIPIPATFSLQLGHVINESQANIQYRFVSDFPFKNRPKHHLDAFEIQALAALRKQPHQTLTQVSWHGLDSRVRYITPIIMGSTCVACHNTHPDSPKRDWKVGDVRGIQELSITQPIVTNIFSFKYLLLFFGCAAALGAGFIAFQRRQTAMIRSMNRTLEGTNSMLASVSTKISRYLSPQVYQSIFSGQTEGTIHTKRKVLTIFFSDLKDFTLMTERLQPEELTAILNEYFTDMSQIALKHGGTVDKFIGDALLVFFGDPETRGVAADAQACLRMAVEMQQQLAKLNVGWRSRGIEAPLRARMGINTGYCDVGNFGSNDRMEYTIIGGEANLAARLQSIAEANTIVTSYESYVLVRDIASARPLPAITMKGISREVVPYVIEGLLDENGATKRIFQEHASGVDLYLDLSTMSDAESERVSATLREAIDALEQRKRPDGVTS
ncbi:MAG: adenylate/guanylate cyclase domain-containing protein [Vulcanimicrobiaceae bacterium]